MCQGLVIRLLRFLRKIASRTRRVASLYNQIMARTWKITENSTEEINFPDETSLDAITRRLPDGYYSTFRTFDGCTRVLGLTAHLERLYGPVSTAEVSAPSLRRQLRALLEPYRPEEARVRAIMTKPGQLYIAIEPLKAIPREVYEQGVRVQTTQLQREHPRLKSTTFIGRSDSERKYIAQEGIFEALLVKDGNILEGMTSNFFYVKYFHTDRDHSAAERPASTSGRQSPPSAPREVILGTALHDILLGVTRQTIIELAQGLGLEVNYQPLRVDQIRDIHETFISSSSRGIVPVVQIDEVTIGAGEPGPVTKRLSKAYRAYVQEKAEKI